MRTAPPIPNLSLRRISAISRAAFGAAALVATACSRFDHWLFDGNAEPAKHVSYPQVRNYGGPVLDSPRVVPIFFANDPRQQRVESFLSQLSASEYWNATTGEYGVGSLRVGPSLLVQDPAPVAADDVYTAAWLAAQLDGAHPGWPTPTASDVFVVFYPATTTVTSGTTSGCVDFGGYHGEGVLGNSAITTDGGSPASGVDASTGPHFAYAVVPSCFPWLGADEIDPVTAALSHELIEAATDPFPATQPAYGLVDTDHLAWTVFPESPGTVSFAGELADLCVYSQGASTLNARLVGNFVVQRSWSNRAAAADRNPCVPPSTDYFNAAPDLVEPVSFTFWDGKQYTTDGIWVPLHRSRTVAVRLFAQQSRADWYVSAQDLVANAGGASTLNFSWDRQTGNDGDVLHLTITRTANGPIGGSPIGIVSSTDPQSIADGYVWPGFVAN